MRKIIGYIAERTIERKMETKQTDTEEKIRRMEKFTSSWRIKNPPKTIEIIQSGRIYNFIDCRAD